MASSVPQQQQQQAAASASSMLNIQNCNGDMTACTFSIRHEDHTLGNVLRHTLIQNEQNVEFAGYSVPHPSEPIVQIRIQTRNNYNTNKKSQSKAMNNSNDTKINTAPQALVEACGTVSKQCDIVLEKLELLLPYVKEDRLQMEQYYIEQNEEEEYDEEEVEEVPLNADNDDEMVEDMTMDD